MTAAPAASHSFAVWTSSSSVTGSAGASTLAASAPVGAIVISVLTIDNMILSRRAFWREDLRKSREGRRYGRIRSRASGGTAGERGERLRRRPGRGRDRLAGPAGPRRGDPRRHPGQGGQARRQAVGTARLPRRDLLLRPRCAAAGDQSVHVVRRHAQGAAAVLDRRRARAR